MPFGLTNPSADFQAFINDILRPVLDIFTTAYLEDILIYSDSLAEHCHHVQLILTALQKAELHLKLEKCFFHQQRVKYLRLKMSNDVEMDADMVIAVSE
jgi:hypothetical protein